MIAFGLLIILVQACWPTVPVVSGMAMIALGATVVTIDRMTSAVARHITTVANLFTYLSLYLLFLGAVYHAAARGPRGRLNVLQWFDVGLSAALMTVVVCLCVAALIRAEHRRSR